MEIEGVIIKPERVITHFANGFTTRLKIFTQTFPEPAVKVRQYKNVYKTAALTRFNIALTGDSEI